MRTPVTRLLSVAVVPLAAAMAFGALTAAQASIHLPANPYASGDLSAADFAAEVGGGMRTGDDGATAQQAPADSEPSTDIDLRRLASLSHGGEGAHSGFSSSSNQSVSSGSGAPLSYTEREVIPRASGLITSIGAGDVIELPSPPGSDLLRPPQVA